MNATSILPRMGLQVDVCALMQRQHKTHFRGGHCFSIDEDRGSIQIRKLCLGKRLIGDMTYDRYGWHMKISSFVTVSVRIVRVTVRYK